jgi:hypothetical protein
MGENEKIPKNQTLIGPRNMFKLEHRLKDLNQSNNSFYLTNLIWWIR